MRAGICSAALLTIASTAASTASAQTHVVGTITLVRTGWNADSFAVVLNVPQQNPARCATPDSYISDASLPGFKTFYTAVLAAYAAGNQTHVVVDDRNCFNSRPKIIGINLPR